MHVDLLLGCSVQKRIKTNNGLVAFKIVGLGKKQMAANIFSPLKILFPLISRTEILHRRILMTVDRVEMLLMLLLMLSREGSLIDPVGINRYIQLNTIISLGKLNLSGQT